MGITFFMNGMLGKFALDELKWGHVNTRDSFTELQFQNHKCNNPNQEPLVHRCTSWHHSHATVISLFI